MQPIYDAATPLLPGRHQPMLVVDHLQSMDVDPEPCLAAIGLDVEQLLNPGCLLSPHQVLQLLRETARRLPDAETAFMLGRQSLPGHFGAASHALQRAGSLRGALQLLLAHPARLSPLMVPHLLVEDRVAVLYWTDVMAAPGLRRFLVEMQMSAWTGLCNWLSGERLPWHYCFNRTQPRRREAHEAHLGTGLRFNCQVDAMLIEPHWLDRPWTNPHGTASPALLHALDREARVDESRRAFLELLYQHLLAQVRCVPSLEGTARAFGLSPATFKRRLAAHGTHFQAELDQVRLHVALQLMHCRGQDNEAVGRHLGLHDAANFRRSLKRWSGLTPSGLRAALPLAGGF